MNQNAERSKKTFALKKIVTGSDIERGHAKRVAESAARDKGLAGGTVLAGMVADEDRIVDLGVYHAATAETRRIEGKTFKSRLPQAQPTSIQLVRAALAGSPDKSLDMQPIYWKDGRKKFLGSLRLVHERPKNKTFGAWLALQYGSELLEIDVTFDTRTGFWNVDPF